MRDDEISVACEQMRLWRRIGLSPAEMIQAVGFSIGKEAKPTLDDAVWAIGRAWVELPRR